jgi:polyisoprenoid-binding protein YceI
MRTVDASSAECLVFVYKEGLLARVAHDLKIRVTKFRIEIDERTHAIQARFDASSLRTVCAMANGTAMAGELSAGDRSQIDHNIFHDVLAANTYPEIAFTSSSVQERGDRYTVKGTLELHGKRRQATVQVHRQDTQWIAETRLHQPDFGITPYTALLGAMKVRADVDIRVSLPADGR